MKAAGRGRGDAQRRGAPPGLEHLARGERGVALADHAVVVCGVAHAEVEEVAAERLDARDPADIFTDSWTCAPSQRPRARS